ncbi:unnamed protein product [Fusarium graminearum]|uniref:Uncharacterized protein n=1 Tax=Gibberella zeae TaxID=5518 RepID=A0A4E9EN69_GIBZA|nr:unnamed protein product [Fusarium graminearum]CAG1970717.1 unnamed protein product [Fusarium graminearum]CAG1980029.1 unnamed protein product [Fusarium graminearum]
MRCVDLESQPPLQLYSYTRTETHSAIVWEVNDRLLITDSKDGQCHAIVLSPPPTEFVRVRVGLSIKPWVNQTSRIALQARHDTQTSMSLRYLDTLELPYQSPDLVMIHSTTRSSACLTHAAELLEPKKMQGFSPTCIRRTRLYRSKRFGLHETFGTHGAATVPLASLEKHPTLCLSGFTIQLRLRSQPHRTMSGFI